jgi:hypothetical protein
MTDMLVLLEQGINEPKHPIYFYKIITALLFLGILVLLKISLKNLLLFSCMNLHNPPFFPCMKISGPPPLWTSPPPPPPHN